MRIIKLDKNDVDQTVVVAGENTTMTGTDEETHERVTIKLNDTGLVNALLKLIAREGSLALPVADFQVVEVEAVRGDWDSPGTSPEGD